LARVAKNLPKRFQGRVKRLEMVNAQLWARSKRLGVLENEIQTKSHIETINGAFGRTIFDTAEGIGATLAFSGLDSRGIDVLLNAPWQGKNYSQRIWGNSSALASQLQQMLAKAIMTGMGEERALWEIRQRFGVAKLATLDGRTSEMCRSHDGQIYKISERQEGVNYPPLHPFCRSTARGYIDKSYEPKMRAARNKLGGKYFVPNISYKEWVKDTKFNPNVEPTKAPTIMPCNP